MSDSNFALPYTGPVILPGLLTVDTLPTPDASMLGTYARVSDLFGDKTDLVLCSLSGGVYFWQPVRPFWPNKGVVSADANMTLNPLKTPSILRISGTLTGNRVITPNTALALPGCEFEVQMVGALSIYSLSIAGLAAGATLSLLLNGTRRIYFDGAAYQAVT